MPLTFWEKRIDSRGNFAESSHEDITEHYYNINHIDIVSSLFQDNLTNIIVRNKNFTPKYTHPQFQNIRKYEKVKTWNFCFYCRMPKYIHTFSFLKWCVFNNPKCNFSSVNVTFHETKRNVRLRTLGKKRGKSRHELSAFHFISVMLFSSEHIHRRFRRRARRPETAFTLMPSSALSKIQLSNVCDDVLTLATRRCFRTRVRALHIFANLNRYLCRFKDLRDVDRLRLHF